MNEIPAEVMEFVALVIIGIICVIVPLVPTILIYKLFPNNTIAVDGPFAGLTVKATGAFAGYLIIFFLMYLKLDGIYNRIADFKPESWTLLGNVELRDSNGKPLVSDDYFRRLVIETRPSWYKADKYGLEVKLRSGLGEAHPKIVVRIDNFGAKIIDPNMENEKKDTFRKVIDLKPIVIMQQDSDVASSKAREDGRFIDNSILPDVSGF